MLRGHLRESHTELKTCAIYNYRNGLADKEPCQPSVLAPIRTVQHRRAKCIAAAKTGVLVDNFNAL